VFCFLVVVGVGWFGVFFQGVCEILQRPSSLLETRVSVGDMKTESMSVSWQGCSDTPQSAC